MAPNTKTLPPVACRSDSRSISSSTSSKKVKELKSISERLEMIIKKMDNLEEFIIENCKNMADHIRTGAWKNRFYKTRLCRFNESGYCSHGANCQFAHCEGELRTVAANLDRW